MPTLAAPKGITSASVIDVPDTWSADWFRRFIRTQLGNADIRNAKTGNGIVITGTAVTPATISVNGDLQALFHQPYVLTGAPSGISSVFDTYRLLAAQSTVLTVTDGGAKGSITVGVAANGIGNNQLRQGSPVSVIGNSSNTLANVADIAAGTDNTALVRLAGTLSFAAVPLGTLATQANNTVVGNVSGGALAPVALSKTQLTTLINAFSATLSGAVPASGGGTTNFLRADGSFAAPAYPTSANPSATIGLAAVNGTAVTFMTSDSAPALSQAITPTWSGLHKFTNGVNLNAATTLLQLYDAAGSTRTGFIIGLAGTGGAGGATEVALDVDGTTVNDWLSLVAGGIRRVRITGTGNMVVNVPTSGDALTISNFAGANALVVTGNAAGTAVVRLNTQATTGAQTASFAATNKPGAVNGSPQKWLPINADGTTYYVPLFS